MNVTSVMVHGTIRHELNKNSKLNRIQVEQCLFFDLHESKQYR